MDKLGLYIHIPFCERKCNYCDFCSYVMNDDIKRKYVDRVIAEASVYRDKGYEFDTVFIGGGTPTAMPSGEIARLVNGIAKSLNIAPIEFTIEGNPNTYTQEKIDEFISCGMTRASVGVQSFNDDLLRSIGRIHDSESAKSALKRLVASGIDVSCDIMIGLPSEIMSDVEYDINTALSLGVTHLSCYSLIVEDGTKTKAQVESGEITLPDDDSCVDMYDRAVELLRSSGLPRYEISNFGKPCIHNVGYWELKNYLGLGVSAHSLIGDTRYYNTTDISEYLSSGSPILEERLTSRDRVIELLILGLRMDKGVRLAKLSEVATAEQYRKILAIIAENKRYYSMDNDYLTIIPEYIYCQNTLIEQFMDI